MGYIVLGMLLLSIFAVLLGVLVSYWISLGLIILYFIGLIVIQRITARNQLFLEKVVLFNTALVLQNLNTNILEPKFRQKAKLVRRIPSSKCLSSVVSLSLGTLMSRGT